MEYGITRSEPEGVTRKSALRLQIEGLKPGQWLDTGQSPSRETTRKLCSMTAVVKAETGHRYQVKGDRKEGTTWVHCLKVHA